MVSMNKLDKLISKINTFCNDALLSLLLIKRGAPPMQTYVSPDDGDEEDMPEPAAGEDVGKYNELLHVANQVRDPGLSSELTLLAELYRKAIEINGGYNSINRSIHNIINMYLEDEEDPQQEEIEDILNEIVSDLRKRAGGAAGLAKPDSPEAIKAMKEMKDNFNTQNLQQEVYDLSNYEESATSTFDPTGGVGKEEAGKGFGRGHSFTTRKSLKDWVDHYNNEQQRYADLLTVVTDASTKSRIQKLLEVLSKLKIATIEENKLTEAYANTNDEQVGNQLAKVKEDNKKLKEERSKLKQGIRVAELTKSVTSLEANLHAAKDEKSKERIRQEIELIKLLASRDVGKTEERNWRRLLLKSMSGGNWPSQETRQKMEEKIKESAAKKKTYEQYQKEQAEKIKSQFKYKPSGGTKRTELRDKAATFEGAVTELQQKIATQKIVVKQSITDTLNAAEHGVFQPYLDKIAQAKAANNPAAIKEAAKELQKAMNTYAESQPPVIAYIDAAQHFYTFRDKAKLLQKSNILESGGPINEAIQTQLASLIEEGNGLISTYKDRKFFATLVKAVGNIIEMIIQRIQQ